MDVKAQRLSGKIDLPKCRIPLDRQKKIPLMWQTLVGNNIFPIRL
jgi:hypothetical protein